MNVLFLAVFVSSAAVLLVKDAAAFLPALLAGAGKAVTLGLQLAAVWAVWLGFLRVAEDAGILRAFSRAARPLAGKLLRTRSAAVLGSASVHLAANFLGMGGAATPAGMRAIRSLREERNGFGQTMLFVVGCAGVQLFPSSAVALAASAGARDPYALYLPALLASICALVVGVGLVLLCYGAGRRRSAFSRFEVRRKKKRGALR